MPRNGLTQTQKDYIYNNREFGAQKLAKTLEVDIYQVYQYAANNGFSVKRGTSKERDYNKALGRLKKSFSRWPKAYYTYKKMLAQRDGLKCHYCNVALDYDYAQVDHVLARARGGTDAPINLVLACAACNNLKSTLCYNCPEFRNNVKPL